MGSGSRINLRDTFVPVGHRELSEWDSAELWKIQNKLF